MLLDGPQFAEYYAGNWTEYCDKDPPKSMAQNKKECASCDPDQDINETDSLCLRLLSVSWPVEFGAAGTPPPTPSRGLKFPQRALAKQSSSTGVVLLGGALRIVGAVALAWGVSWVL